jgi:hypothetical protein
MTPEFSKLQDQRDRFLFLWIIPTAVVASVCIVSRVVLSDGDTFWHIAAGRWIIDHGAVPKTDPFSFTFRGRPWVAHEWLSEVAFAAAFGLAGWSGVVLLTAFAAGALIAVMAGWLLRWLSPLSTFLALTLAFSCVTPSLLARPHLLVLPLLALWTVGLLKAREQARAPSLWLALVMTLWANLHASFAIGFVIAGAFVLELLLDFRAWRRGLLLGWAAFLASSALATLATPHGLAGLAFPVQLLNVKALALVTEWQPPDFMRVSTLEVAFLVGIFLAFWRGIRVPAVRTLLLLGLLHMSLQHARHEMILGVAAPLVLAEPFGRAMGAQGARPISWRLPLPQTALGSCILAIVVVLRLAAPEVRTDGISAPITALARVPSALRAAPVLNDYDLGGYLIFEGVSPYIDGRTDMYGDAFMNDDFAIENGDPARLAAAVARYHIAWSIQSPERPLVGVLDRMGWERIYADRWAVVQVRPPTPSAPPPAAARPSSAHG